MAALFSVTLILTLTKSGDYLNMQFKNVLCGNVFFFFFFFFKTKVIIIFYLFIYLNLFYFM